MDHQTYLKLKNALIEEWREATSSPEAASRYIDKLGIRDLLVPINSAKKQKRKKVSGGKTIAK
ncbi:hypothetical protein SAMN05428949_2745 [Chitinophaga sp. YR627]|uniref:hypothetical protein n=1 Tax=Chitinophaga sp. YR627 TaxID=1881041 RepID=UPI0008E7436D|nr:hypothetical protein [Chitinophaga sp. YR627]SFN41126.1 hypothetical protein SAMN05428949_2745 [Chitinophaga sp. YR627]